MRALLILLPALALAQTPPATTPGSRHDAAESCRARRQEISGGSDHSSQTGGSHVPSQRRGSRRRRRGAGRGAAGRGAASRTQAGGAAAPLTTDDEKTVYALGLMMGQSLSMFNLTPAELEIVKRALTDSAAGKPALELSEWGPKIQPLATSRAAAVAVKEKASSAAYLAKCAAEPGAVKTDSGLVYRELKAGRPAHRPKPPTR